MFERWELIVLCASQYDLHRRRLRLDQTLLWPHPTNSSLARFLRNVGPFCRPCITFTQLPHAPLLAGTAKSPRASSTPNQRPPPKPKSSLGDSKRKTRRSDPALSSACLFPSAFWAVTLTRAAPGASGSSSSSRPTAFELVNLILGYRHYPSVRTPSMLLPTFCGACGSTRRGRSRSRSVPSRISVRSPSISGGLWPLADVGERPDAADMVLTVPAAWDAAGCALMREAALRATLVQSSRGGDKNWRDRLRIITCVSVDSTLLSPADHAHTQRTGSGRDPRLGALDAPPPQAE